MLSQSDLQSIWDGPDPLRGSDCGCEIAAGMGQYGCCPSYLDLADASNLADPNNGQGCSVALSDLAGKWYLENGPFIKYTINRSGLGIRTDTQPNRVFRISRTQNQPRLCDSFTFLMNDQQPWLYMQLSADKNRISGIGGILIRESS